MKLQWLGGPAGSWSTCSDTQDSSSQTITLDDNQRTLTWCNDTLGKNSFAVHIESKLNSLYGQSPREWLRSDQATESDRVRNDVLSFSTGTLTLHFAVQPRPPGKWEEVDPNFIHSIDAATGERRTIQRQDRISFQPKEEPLLLTAPQAHQELCRLVCDSVSKSIGPTTVANILFSGGLDSTILAAACAVNRVESVNLFNVSFAGGAAPDRLTSLLSYTELVRTYPNTTFTYCARDVTPREHEAEHENIMAAIYPRESLMDFTIGSTIYFASKLRGKHITYDSVLTLLGDSVTKDALDLDVQNLCCKTREPRKIYDNSVFEMCNKCAKLVCKHDCAGKLCRSCCKKTGLEAPEYACRPHGVNKANLKTDQQSEVEKRLLTLWPDAYAAASAIDLPGDGHSKTILCGNGADELFGGYSRYSTCEMHGSLPKWREEMTLDLQRLWKRNFGRDSRVITAASNGLVRCELPFFEPELIDWVRGITNEDLWHGILRRREYANNKALLREMCECALGLKQVALFKKRAMQFGSRSAMTIFADSNISRRSQKGVSTEWTKEIFMSSSRRILFLFDVDGTLCRSQQLIEKSTIAWLKRLSQAVEVGIVTGSDRAKILRQFDVDKLEALLDKAGIRYVLSENSVQAIRIVDATKSVVLHSGNILEYFGESFYQDVVNFCLAELSKIRLPVKRDCMIETRGGNINVSPIGRRCSQAERLEFAKFDREHQVRQKLVQNIRERFGDKLYVGKGGQISVDISPAPWTKKLALDIFAKEGYDNEQIYFYGDNCGDGGNDEVLYRALPHGFWVKDEPDCLEQVRGAMKSLCLDF